MSDGLDIVVVYDKTTKDFPGEYVARIHTSSGAGGQATVAVAAELFARGPTLANVRRQIRRKRPGLVRLARHPQDDPVILETWL